MHIICIIILATKTIFIELLCITLPKLHVKLQPHPLKIFWAQLEKVQKTHNLCIIMLINPSSCNLSETNIFDLQIRGAVHTQVTTQNVNMTLWVGRWVWKGVLRRYAVPICILFPEIKSKLITSQNNHAESIILLPTFFNCFTNFTALAKVLLLIVCQTTFSKEIYYFSLCSAALKCKWRHLYFDLQCQEYNVLNIYNLLQLTSEWQHSKHAYY